MKAATEGGRSRVDFQRLTGAMSSTPLPNYAFRNAGGLRFDGRARGTNVIAWPLGRTAERHGEGRVVVVPPSAAARVATSARRNDTGSGKRALTRRRVDAQSCRGSSPPHAEFPWFARASARRRIEPRKARQLVRAGAVRRPRRPEADRLDDGAPARGPPRRGKLPSGCSPFRSATKTAKAMPIGGMSGHWMRTSRRTWT